MKPKLLAKLIQKTQHEIDETRLEKVKLEERIDFLTTKIAHLEQELIDEQEIASNDINSRHTYENFYLVSKERQDVLNDELKDCKCLITMVEDKLFSQFRTYKQFEILLSKHEKDVFEKMNKEESKLLDEVGLQRKRFNL